MPSNIYRVNHLPAVENLHGAFLFFETVFVTLCAQVVDYHAGLHPVERISPKLC
jgi:hypothetical protein